MCKCEIIVHIAVLSNHHFFFSFHWFIIPIKVIKESTISHYVTLFYTVQYRWQVRDLEMKKSFKIYNETKFSWKKVIFSSEMKGLKTNFSLKRFHGRQESVFEISRIIKCKFNFRNGNHSFPPLCTFVGKMGLSVDEENIDSFSFPV